MDNDIDESSHLKRTAVAYRFSRIAFEHLSNQLVALRDEAFPNGSVVCSVGPYTQWGIVDTYGNCPPDHIGVLFENGNTWNKEFCLWVVVSNRKLWPADMKGRVMQFKRKRKAPQP